MLVTSYRLRSPFESSTSVFVVVCTSTVGRVDLVSGFLPTLFVSAPKSGLRSEHSVHDPHILVVPKYDRNAVFFPDILKVRIYYCCIYLGVYVRVTLLI